MQDFYLKQLRELEELAHVYAFTSNGLNFWQHFLIREQTYNLKFGRYQRKY